MGVSFGQETKVEPGTVAHGNGNHARQAKEYTRVAVQPARSLGLGPEHNFWKASAQNPLTSPGGQDNGQQNEPPQGWCFVQLVRTRRSPSNRVGTGEDSPQPSWLA